MNSPTAYVPTAHEWRQHFRMAADGWTLPSWICGLYWFGLERIAPKRSRVQWVPDVRLGLWKYSTDLKPEDKEWVLRQLELSPCGR